MTGSTIRKNHRRRSAAYHLLAIWFVSSGYVTVEAWSPVPVAVRETCCKPLQSLLRKLKSTSSTFLLGASIFFFDPATAAAAATDMATPSVNADAVTLSSGLSAPTPETPQIKFSGNRPNQGRSTRTFGGSAQVLRQTAGKSPILQGLIYIDRPNSRPNFSDTLVLTAGTVDRPDEVLAGAKVAITQARFPMQFSMYKENIIRGKEDMWSKAMDGDILVTARVCPEEAKLPCSDEESTYKARGVSKLIRNLPGMDKGTIVRSAISLPLK